MWKPIDVSVLEFDSLSHGYVEMWQPILYLYQNMAIRSKLVRQERGNQSTNTPQSQSQLQVHLQDHSIKP